MAIAASDIVYRLSGGASNAAPDASLGGAKSSSVADVGAFDVVSASESTAGAVEYRCLYIHNAHATLPLIAAVAWILANTPNANTSVEIGVGTSSTNGVEQSVANPSTAPSSVTFVTAANLAAGVALGDIPAGQHRAIWIRRTVVAGANASADGFTMRITGESDA